MTYDLFPVQDTGLLIGSIQGDQSISFQAMKQKLAQLQGIVQADPAVADGRGRHRRAADQFRLRLHLAEAVRRAPDHRRRRGGAAARQARRRRRGAAVHGRRLRPAHRRAAEQRDLSIYAALRRHGRALQMGAASARRAAGQPSAQGRQFRPAAGRPRGRRDDRPRQRRPARPHHRGDRQHALRRFRPAAGVDHLQRAQPVSRGDGGRAALLAGPLGAERHLGVDFRR